MKQIKKTKQLEYDKSTFIIDLIEMESGLHYIEVLQTIHNQNSVRSCIKINPSILMDIINVLLEFYQIIPLNQIPGDIQFTEKDKKEIQDRYLKGIPIKDLAMQFDVSELLIEMILRNKNLVIMNDVAIPLQKKGKWKKKKRDY